MSKQGKRKITVELPKNKEAVIRPSVFERLGTKKSSAKKTTESCRQWAVHGNCAYGKACKFASTHILISPSKQRAANKDDKRGKEDAKNRLHSTVVVRSGRSPDGDIDNWDQNDLEYADTDVLEKRRQQLQRELELQLKMESGKDNLRKEKKKPVSSSSSSRSSSTSSVSSSLSEGSSSSSSRDPRRRAKKTKRNSSSSSDGDVPSKKKLTKADALKKDKGPYKKSVNKKDDRTVKKHEVNKKKTLSKTAITKRTLSPGKKSGGTPPITSKTKIYSSSKQSKSPRREKNRSITPIGKDKKDREKDREKDKDRERRRSKSRGRVRSRSPRRHDSRRKDSVERTRGPSPKKNKKDGSADRHKKKSPSRDRRDLKDRSDEKKKQDDKDRKQRERDRKDLGKRDDKRNRGGRERGLKKGLEKPAKPMERLLPKPEERLAALAAISNRNQDIGKSSPASKDRQDIERRKNERDREKLDRSKRPDRTGSLERERTDYERPYDHGVEYERDRYDEHRDEDDRSSGYGRRYEDDYDINRGYTESENRGYGEHHPELRDIGFDERRPRRDRSWDNQRTGSVERDRGYGMKEWQNEDYRGGDWPRERHWQPHHVPQIGEWGEGDGAGDWHRPHHMQRHHGFGRGGARGGLPKRGAAAPVPTPTPTAPATASVPAPATTPAQPPAPPPVQPSPDEGPIPDDLSEISDDPDDILTRDDPPDVQNEEEKDENVGANVRDKVEQQEEANHVKEPTVSSEEKSETQEIKDDEDGLDFEEISDGELEEERNRASLGDALGVDWASLVAEVRRREEQAPEGGARDRWRPDALLASLGILAPDVATATEPSPHAAIRVSKERVRGVRAALWGGGGCGGGGASGGAGCVVRALSARRDLALRRHLARLPATDRAPPRPHHPHPHLYQAARHLLTHG